MKDKTTQAKEQILKYYMHTKKRIKSLNPPVKKNILENKKVLFIFFILIVFSIIGYEVYKRDLFIFEPVKKKIYSPIETQSKSRTTQIETSIPKINVVRLQIESIDNIDKLRVIIDGKGGDKPGILYFFEWFKNGEPFGTNTDNISGFKKGDKIDVKITPFDGNQYGLPKTLSIEIAKTAPKVVESKEISYDGKLLSYQVKAIDPNGGELQYLLMNAPKGMTINSESGIIKWEVNEKGYGKHNVVVKISNKDGAETLYPLAIDIGEVTD